MAGELGISKSKLPRVSISSSLSLANAIKLSPPRIPKAEIIGRFESAINRASQRITVDLKEALDSAIRSSVWQTNSGNADIYDTGELMESGVVSMTSEGVTIAYSAPYAALVHYGGYINPYGRQEISVYLPPRPWVESVLFGGGPLQSFDFASYYREEIEKEFS